MNASKDDPASRPENSEWTEDDMRRARPGLDVIAEVFGSETAEELRRAEGDRQSKKVLTTLRIDPTCSLLTSGKDWRLRINQVLRQHIPRNRG